MNNGYDYQDFAIIGDALSTLSTWSYNLNRTDSLEAIAAKKALERISEVAMRSHCEPDAQREPVKWQARWPLYGTAKATHTTWHDYDTEAAARNAAAGDGEVRALYTTPPIDPAPSPSGPVAFGWWNTRYHTFQKNLLPSEDSQRTRHLIESGELLPVYTGQPSGPVGEARVMLALDWKPEDADEPNVLWCPPWPYRIDASGDRVVMTFADESFEIFPTVEAAKAAADADARAWFANITTPPPPPQGEAIPRGVVKVGEDITVHAAGEASPAAEGREDAIPAEFAQLGTFYGADTLAGLLRQMEGHIEKLQDAARRNVKPWEDTFPPTLLPRYLRENGLPPERPPATVVIHTATPAEAAREGEAKDAELLDALRENCWDLRCFAYPDSGEDKDVGWRVVSFHMAEPRERVVAEVYTDEPRAAIRAALASKDDSAGGGR